MAGLSALSAPADDFAAGNQFFQNKQYDEAIKSYSAVLSQGMESAPLYFNMGNAYFKKGNLGYSILYYMKARRLDPGDDDIKSNLEFAKRYTSVQLEGVTLNPINNMLESITSPHRLSAMAWWSSLFFVLLLGLLIVRYGLGIAHPLLKPTILVMVAVLLASSYLTTFKYRHDYLTRRAVIVAQQCEVRTGPSDQSDIELHGEPGLVVEVLSETGDYYNVLFENQRQGWVRKDLVAIV
jgi:tetratricopeptide (TPR) repeat protein